MLECCWPMRRIFFCDAACVAAAAPALTPSFSALNSWFPFILSLTCNALLSCDHLLGQQWSSPIWLAWCSMRPACMAAEQRRGAPPRDCVHFSILRQAPCLPWPQSRLLPSTGFAEPYGRVCWGRWGLKGAKGGSGCVEMVAAIHNVQCKGLHSPWAAQDEEPKPLHPAVPQSGLQLVTI